MADRHVTAALDNARLLEKHGYTVTTAAAPVRRSGSVGAGPQRARQDVSDQVMVLQFSVEAKMSELVAAVDKAFVGRTSVAAHRRVNLSREKGGTLLPMVAITLGNAAHAGTVAAWLQGWRVCNRILVAHPHAPARPGGKATHQVLQVWE